MRTSRGQWRQAGLRRSAAAAPTLPPPPPAAVTLWIAAALLLLLLPPLNLQVLSLAGCRWRLTCPSTSFLSAAPPAGLRLRGSRPSAVARQAVLHDHAEIGLLVRAGIRYACDDPEALGAVDLNPALEFVCGAGDVPRGIDEGVVGMAVGETRELHFGDDDPLFGAWDEAKMVEVPIQHLENPQVGSVVSLEAYSLGGSGVVRELHPTTAAVDLNHPLAGRGLTVTISIMGVEEAPGKQEVRVQTVSAGDGETYPHHRDVVTVHYVASLAVGGSPFESSRDGGAPLRFRIGSGEVFPGLEEGVERLSLRERATIRVPAALGYGPGGKPGSVPPNADLVLDVELLDIESELELAL